MKEIRELPEKYKIGISQVDIQHGQIIAALEDLVGLKTDDSALQKIMGDVVHDLIRYFHHHFGYEEKMLLKFEYPLIDAHVKLHVEFTEYIKTLNPKSGSYELHEAQELARFLKKWFLEHINVEDRKYAKFISENSKGV